VVIKSLEIGVIRLHVGRSRLFDLPRLGGLERDVQGLGDALRDVALDREHVGQVAIVILGPEMGLTAYVDQLRGDAQAVAGLLDAALEKVAHVERETDRSSVPRLLLQ
jgi:hypothetical protein